jgi:hypothetical protein
MGNVMRIAGGLMMLFGVLFTLSSAPTQPICRPPPVRFAGSQRQRQGES